MIQLNKEKISDIKKLVIFLYRRVLGNPYIHVGLILIGIVYLSYYLYTFQYLKVEIPDIIYKDQKNLYVIDSGHGYNEKNKCQWKSTKDGEGCFYEYEFNMGVVNYLCSMLDDANIFYVRTDTLPHKRDMSITERKNLVNSFKELFDEKKATAEDRSIVLFSIHANAAKNSEANGLEVFTSVDKCKKYKNAEVCKSNMHTLATLLSDNLKLTFPNKNFRSTSKAEYKETSMANEGEITLLDETDCYAVLSENGFYTNPSERQEMKTKEYQIKIAMAHYKTICALEEINP